jgi:hypothetical protein
MADLHAKSQASNSPVQILWYVLFFGHDPFYTSFCRIHSKLWQQFFHFVSRAHSFNYACPDSPYCGRRSRNTLIYSRTTPCRPNCRRIGIGRLSSQFVQCQYLLASRTNNSTIKSEISEIERNLHFENRMYASEYISNSSSFVSKLGDGLRKIIARCLWRRFRFPIQELFILLISHGMKISTGSREGSNMAGSASIAIRKPACGQSSLFVKEWRTMEFLKRWLTAGPLDFGCPTRTESTSDVNDSR